MTECRWLSTWISVLVFAAMCVLESDGRDAKLLAEGQRGVEAFQRGDFETAISIFRSMERQDPNDFEILLNIGLCYDNLNHVDDAERYYNKALQIDASRSDVWNTLGGLHLRKGQVGPSLAAYGKAIALSPTGDDLYFNRGNAHQARGDHVSAVEDFKKAIELRDDNYQAWNNMGSAYMSLTENKLAIQALRKTLTFIPTHPIPLTNLVITENRICEWGRRRKHNKMLRAGLHSELAEGRALVTPFHALEFNFTAQECLQNAQAWSRKVDHSISFVQGFEPGGSTMTGRLKIGYFSGSGFHNSTTTARSMRSQYSLHNRMYTEVYCYAGQGDDGSEPRRVIMNGCDKFVEVEGLSHVQIAEMIRADGVNVLIDLTGYTMSMQTQVMAIGPSPVQVSFHGFPGSMGAEFIHYLVSDKLTSPPENEDQFTERLMLVPHTYLTNDHRQSRREVYIEGDHPEYGPQPTRAEFGFSDDDIILSCFNQLYKIEPDVFLAWMEILQAVPRAKLWLLRFTSQGEDNLRKQAKKLGVDPARLVFHDQFPREREFRIKGLAELFLDTPLFNAHTTGGDVLWSSIPLLTIPGENFAQRVASGLLLSANLPLLIARNLEDYKAMAVALASRAGRRRALKAKLRAQREQAPLFDTQRLTQELEVGLMLAWDCHDAIGAPYHIVVAKAE